jgi:hypothetical protein
VEPTNNCVEQALRIAVQLRKIIFGNRSAQGEVATARLLTVTQTCQMQGRNALGYLTEAILRLGTRIYGRSNWFNFLVLILGRVPS